MREDMRIRNLAQTTQKRYIDQVAAFARHFGRSPADLGPEHIRTWQVHLAEERGLSWSSRNVAVCALRFFYSTTLDRNWVIKHIPFAKAERRLRVVLSPEEVRQFLAAATNIKHRTVFMACYSAGLRVSEVIQLRVDDIDSKRMVIHVRAGKGRKDRLVPLSVRLLKALRAYWPAVRPTRFLFPGRDACRPIARTSVYEACRRTARRAGIKKLVTPHTLRHCCATHMLEAGVDLRTIQVVLGHASFSTTSRYIHIATSKLGSAHNPLDLLDALPVR